MFASVPIINSALFVTNDEIIFVPETILNVFSLTILPPFSAISTLFNDTVPKLYIAFPALDLNITLDKLTTASSATTSKTDVL